MDLPILSEVEWRAPAWAIARWIALMEDLLDLDMYSEEALDIKDQIKSLPNFPLNTDTQTLINIVNTTAN